MRKTIIINIILCLTLIGQAQIIKTVNINNAGTLSTILTVDELNTVSNLTISGMIDARDFKTMRDNMPMLAILDISAVTIKSYIGYEGTAINGWDNSYADNEIPEYSFAGENNNNTLKTIILPCNFNSIGNSGIIGCSALTEFIIPNENTNFSSIDGVVFNKDQTILIQYPGGKKGDYIIPKTVISIGNSAFFDCDGLTNVIIPDSVTRIGPCAFAFCNELNTVIIGKSVNWVGEWAFGFCSGLSSIYSYAINPPNSDGSFSNVDTLTCKLYVPNGSKTVYQNAPGWKNFNNIIEMTTESSTVSLINEEFNLYPNPVTESFNINGFKDIASLKLFDINGKVILNKQITSNETISANNLPKGVYIVKLITAEGIVEKKLIKK
jgi:hypothetical protein